MDVYMNLELPPLEVGRTYTGTELLSYVAEDDLVKVTQGFPKDLERWPHENLLAWSPEKEVLFEFAVWDISVLRSQIEDFSNVFRSKQDEWNRVCRIVELLEGGAVAFPVFAQFNDPKRRISEGMHRSVAMLELGVRRVPVLLAKYADWTPETPS
jgi:hypothetical protein